MGQLRVLNQAGDETLEWDLADEESVAKAKEEWERLQGEGYEFFEAVEAKGKRVQEFSKGLGKVIAAPGVQTKEDKQSGGRPKAMAGGPNDRLLA